MSASVLVCSYGGEEWKRLADRAVESVKNQGGWLEYEIVAQHHHYDSTIADVRNEAARIATGDWLCFLDADDELAPGYLAAIGDAVCPCCGGADWYDDYPAPDARFVYCGHCDWPPAAPMSPAEWRASPRNRSGGTPATPGLLVPAVQYIGLAGDPEGPPRIPAWERPLIEVNCAVIGTLIPRALFLELGGFRELPSLEDWDLWLRAIRAGAKMLAVPDAVYVAHRSRRGRNGDQSPYNAIRAEFEPGFPWNDVKAYKAAR